MASKLTKPKKKKSRLEYESKIDTLDIVETKVKQIFIRDILSPEYLIAIYDDKIPSKPRKCLLIQVQYKPDPEDLG